MMIRTAFATKAIVASMFLLGPTWPLVADEPVIGGPCEGCELVFVGKPEELAPETRIAAADEPGEPMRADTAEREE